MPNAANVASLLVNRGTIAPAGASTAAIHENSMPSLSINFIICVKGLFPSASDISAPIVTLLAPRSGPSNPSVPYTVTISGFNFGVSPSVAFGNIPAQVMSATSTKIVVTCPVGMGTVPVYVTSSGKTSGSTAGTFFVYSPGIERLTPARGPSTGGTLVSIRGVGFLNPNDPVQAVTFGSVSSPDFEVLSDSMIRAATPSQAEVGGAPNVPVSVVLQSLTTSMAGTYAQLFQYESVVSKIEPSFGPPSGGNVVTITGNNFIDGDAVFIGPNLASQKSFSPTQVEVVAPPGAGDVELLLFDRTVTQVQNANPVPVGRAKYSYRPKVHSINPVWGQAGTHVVISGENFTADATAKIGPLAATVIGSTTATTITVVVPNNGFGTMPITVTTPGGTNSEADAPIFNFAPFISSMTPSGGTPNGGNTLQVVGGNFTPGSTVMFGNTTAESVYVSPTQISVVAPPLAGANPQMVTIRNGFGTSGNTQAAIYTYGVSVSSVQPANIPATGGSVTLTGYGFGSDSTVQFGAQAGSNVVVAQDGCSLQCTAPAGSGICYVTVSSGGATSPTGLQNQASYAPSVQSLSPDAGPRSGGTTVTLSGGGFVPGATTVWFGPTFAANQATNVNVVSPTSLTCTTPPFYAPCRITVQTAGGTFVSESNLFSFVPYADSVEPPGAPMSGGLFIHISGRGFKSASKVTFDQFSVATPASILTVESDERMTVLAPPGGQPGIANIAVTTDAGTNTIANFVYAPYIETVSPQFGPIAGGTVVTITGSGFGDGVKAVKFGENEATNFVLNASGTITATTPPGEGSVNVVVLAANGRAEGFRPIHFNYNPKISGVVSSLGNGVGVAGGTVKIVVSGMDVWPVDTSLKEQISFIQNNYPWSGTILKNANTAQWRESGALLVRLPLGLKPGPAEIQISNGLGLSDTTFTITIVGP